MNKRTQSTMIDPVMFICYRAVLIRSCGSICYFFLSPPPAQKSCFKRHAFRLYSLSTIYRTHAMAVLLFAFKLPFLLITSTLSLTFVARPHHFSPRSIRSRLSAEIRPPTPKADNLAFGWDGTTAKGGAVDDSKPSRMLEEILATGETIPSEIEVSACPAMRERKIALSEIA